MRHEDINITIGDKEWSATKLSQVTGFSVSLFTRALRQGAGMKLDTAAEIAWKLGVSIDSVWQAVVRARKAMGQKKWRKRQAVKAKGGDVE